MTYKIVLMFLLVGLSLEANPLCSDVFGRDLGYYVGVIDEMPRVVSLFKKALSNKNNETLYSYLERAIRDWNIMFSSNQVTPKAEWFVYMWKSDSKARSKLLSAMRKELDLDLIRVSIKALNPKTRTVAEQIIKYQDIIWFKLIIDEMKARGIL